MRENFRGRNRHRQETSQGSPPMSGSDAPGAESRLGGRHGFWSGAPSSSAAAGSACQTAQVSFSPARSTCVCSVLRGLNTHLLLLCFLVQERLLQVLQCGQLLVQSQHGGRTEPVQRRLCRSYGLPGPVLPHPSAPRWVLAAASASACSANRRRRHQACGLVFSRKEERKQAAQTSAFSYTRNTRHTMASLSALGPGSGVRGQGWSQMLLQVLEMSGFIDLFFIKNVIRV